MAIHIREIEKKLQQYYQQQQEQLYQLQPHPSDSLIAQFWSKVGIEGHIKRP